MGSKLNAALAAAACVSVFGTLATTAAKADLINVTVVGSVKSGSEAVGPNGGDGVIFGTDGLLSGLTYTATYQFTTVGNLNIQQGVAGGFNFHGLYGGTSLADGSVSPVVSVSLTINGHTVALNSPSYFGQIFQWDHDELYYEAR